MKKLASLSIAAFFLLWLGCYPAQSPSKPFQKKAKNVVLFIGDGMGPAQITLGRLAIGDLSFDRFLVTGKVKTSCSDNVVTDSAAAVTAYGAGWKTGRGVLAMVQEGDKWKRVRTLMEYLRDEKGYAVGVVTTTRITHATPAGFLSHVRNRHFERAIARQLVSSGAQVMMGGGRRYFLPFLFDLDTDFISPQLLDEAKDIPKLSREFKKKNRPLSSHTVIRVQRKGYRWLVEDLKKHYLIKREGKKILTVYLYTPLARDLEKQGYLLLTSRKELLQSGPDQKMVGLFARSHMSHEIDRTSDRDEPSLEEMTSKAVAILQKTGKPFFLMVEGGRIDHSGHDHDALGLVLDIQSLSKAVEGALKWAGEKMDTLVVVTADHATGSLGISRSFKREYFTRVLEGHTVSAEEIGRRIVYGDEDPAYLLKYYDKIMDLTPRELSFLTPPLKGRRSGTLALAIRRAVGHVRSNRAGIYYYPLEYYGTLPEHSGVDVPLYAYGPGSFSFSGTYENTDIPIKISQALGMVFRPVFDGEGK